MKNIIFTSDILHNVFQYQLARASFVSQSIHKFIIPRPRGDSVGGADEEWMKSAGDDTIDGPTSAHGRPSSQITLNHGGPKKCSRYE